MSLIRRIVTSILLGAAMGGALGCVVHEHDEPRPVPVGYVYEPVYYNRGYYRGDDWYWHDREGHLFHERREDHERRAREFSAPRDDRRDEHHDDRH